MVEGSSPSVGAGAFLFCRDFLLLMREKSCLAGFAHKGSKLFIPMQGGVGGVATYVRECRQESMKFFYLKAAII